MNAPTPEKTYRVISLSVSNILGLKAGFKIVPDGQSVTLTGENGAGKSSVLNTIAMLLTGRKGVPDVPIRLGSTKGDATMDLGDMVITMKITQASGAKITMADKATGAEIKSPQTILDRIWNEMCDPVKWMDLSKSPDGRRRQAEKLRQIVGLDFTALDTEKATCLTQRTLVGRELEAAKGRLSGYKFDENAPKEPVTVKALMDELEAVRNHNKANEAVKAHWQEVADLAEEKRTALGAVGNDIIEIENEIAAWQKRLADKRAERETLTIDLQRAEKAVEEEQAKVAVLVYQDEAPVQAKIDGADALNQAVRGNARYREIEKEVRDADAKYVTFTSRIAEIEESKTSHLAKAKFPLPGLSFNDDGVMLDNVPFAQGSQAKQLLAATAIGLALGPKIRVVLIRDGSLFDKKSLAAVAKLAEEQDAQVFMEIVESSDPGAILIEDGAVVERKVAA